MKWILTKLSLKQSSRLLLVGLTILGLAELAQAQDQESKQPAGDVDRSEETITSDEVKSKSSDLPRWAVNSITPVHTIISSVVENASRNIDGFFGTDEFLNVDNHSYLRISQEYQWFESGPDVSDTGTRFKLDLPTSEKRLKLVVESNPEEEQAGLLTTNANRVGQDEINNADDSVIGLVRTSKDDGDQHWRKRINAGVKLHLPLDPYLRISARRSWHMSDSAWFLENRSRLSWFDSQGYFARTRWDLGRAIDERMGLRFVSQLQWRETVDTMEWVQRAEINQVLSSRQGVRYSVWANILSASKPKVAEYIAQIFYRRDIHDQYLFLDIVPELHFTREADFAPRWALTARLELYFRGDVVRR